MKTKMMNNAKLPFLAMLTILALFGLVSSVNAASFSCNTSIRSTLNRLTELNATYNTTSSGTANFDTITVLFEALSVSAGINTSFSVIANISNTSNRNHVNLTLGDDIKLPDAGDYTFRVTCFNGTGTGSGSEGGTTSSSTTGVTIDRTRPVVRDVTNLGTALKTSTSSITFGVSNATRWSLRKNSVEVASGTVVSNFVNTSVTQSFITGTQGTYFIRLSDGLNTTDSSTFSYRVISSTSADDRRIVEKKEEIIRQQQQQNPNSKKMALLLVGAALFVMLFIVILLIMNTGNKRRRR